MTTLLFAEVANGHLSDITARALTAALQLGGPVDILIAGSAFGLRDIHGFSHSLVEPTLQEMYARATGDAG